MFLLLVTKQVVSVSCSNIMLSSWFVLCTRLEETLPQENMDVHSSSISLMITNHCDIHPKNWDLIISNESVLFCKDSDIKAYLQIICICNDNVFVRF